jgi:Ca2+:H+ antiporter
VAVVMFVLYVLYLFYILRSPGGSAQGEGEAPFGRTASLVLLFVATAAVAYVSEAFVGAIEPLTEEYGISELFVGVILVPIVGNIAEHVVGVQIAYKNDMGISLGSSIQVALLVTPILVFLGPLLGSPLHLIFTSLELGALGAAVVVTGFVALDGKSNWLEGAMLCGVYIIAALAFFFSP